MPRLNTTVARAGLTLVVLCALSWTEAASQDLGSIEDRLLIAEQLAQYSYRWDAKDSAGFADLFTDDGVMERRRGGEVVSGSRVVGRQAILDYATTSHQGRLADRQTRHHFSALVFLELSSDSAITENMALITHQTADDRTAFISGSGIYRNTWKKTGQGWKIAERVLFTDRFTGRQRPAVAPRFVARTGADEVIIAGHIFDHDARLRSFEIIAEQLVLAPA